MNIHERKLIYPEPKAVITVSSTDLFKDEMQEAVDAERMLMGFNKELFYSTPLSWVADVNVRRSGFSGSRYWEWFRLDILGMDEWQKRLFLRVNLDVKAIGESKLLADFKFDEGDVIETIGFYLQPWMLRFEILRKERRNMLFLRDDMAFLEDPRFAHFKYLSEYKYDGNYDELWPATRGFHFQYLLERYSAEESERMLTVAQVPEEEVSRWEKFKSRVFDSRVGSLFKPS